MALEMCIGRLVPSRQASVAIVVFGQPHSSRVMPLLLRPFPERRTAHVEHRCCKLATLQNKPLVVSSHPAVLLITLDYDAPVGKFLVRTAQRTHNSPSTHRHPRYCSCGCFSLYVVARLSETSLCFLPVSIRGVGRRITRTNDILKNRMVAAVRAKSSSDEVIGKRSPMQLHAGRAGWRLTRLAGYCHWQQVSVMFIVTQALQQ